MHGHDLLHDGDDNGVALSIVVPVFDEEPCIVPLLREIGAVLDGLGGTSEVLVIDDGSTDGTLAALRAHRAAEPRLRIVTHARRCGQSAALATGFRESRGNVVVTLDGDGQNDPADIPALLQQLEGADVVCGVRRQRHDSLVRRLSSRVGNRFRDLVTGVRVSDAGCTLRAMRRHVLDELPVFDGMHRFLSTLLHMAGHRVVEMDVRHRPRTAGRSKYGIGNRLGRGLLDCFAVRWWRARGIPAAQARIAEREHAIEPAATRMSRGHPFVLAGLAGAGLLAVYASPLGEWISHDGVARLQALVRSWGAAGPAGFALLTAVGVAIGAPRLFFAAVSGAVFGLWTGVALTTIGTLAGCLFTFSLARRLGRSWVAARLPPRLAGLSDHFRDHGLLTTLYVRAVPVGNCHVANLLMGVSPVRPRDFTLGTLFGSLPETVIYALLGSAALQRTGERLAIGLALLAVLVLGHLWLRHWFAARQLRVGG